MSVTPIRVMIVDDHAVVREGLVALIETQNDMNVVSSISRGEDALAAFEQHNPHIVLLDLRLAGMDGIETLVALRGRFATARVIMISSQEGDEAIHRALREGALGYVFKRADSEEVLAAIRAAHKGERVRMSDAVANQLAARVSYGQLSDREIEVLQAVARGLGNKEIATQLDISPSTVKNHLNNIMAKLDASDRTHAVTIAVQRGIIELNT
jgi:two-component system NarL family response regulator